MIQLSTPVSTQKSEGIVKILNTILVDEYVLYTKTRNALLVVKEARFFELNKYFDFQQKELDKIIKQLAEHIRSLGHFALGSLKDFLNTTNLLKDTIDFKDPLLILQALIQKHEYIIKNIRTLLIPTVNIYNDLATADFILHIMIQHKKMAWMLTIYK